MNKNKLSADPLALILGIIALVIGIAGCCCYGITAIIPLIMAIIGLVSANRSIKEYETNPEVFSLQSRNNVGTAKVINIIAIVMNGLVVIFSIAAIAFYGTMVSSEMFNEFNKMDTYNDNIYQDYEWQSDTINEWEDDDYIIEEETDSVSIDVIEEKVELN